MKIAIVTTSRADWNGLSMVWRALKDQHDVGVVCAGHSTETAAMVMGEITGPSPSLICIATGSPAHQWPPARAGVIIEEVARDLIRSRPDLVLVLGDRYETLAAAQAALLCRIPIVHLDGGDVTLGSWDNQIRNAVSQLAHVHFPCDQESADRLLDMGINGSRVHPVGSTHVDRALATALLDRRATLEAIGLTGCESFVLVNWQPETGVRDPNAGLRQVALPMVEAMTPDVGVLFVGPGADLGAADADDMIRDFVGQHQPDRPMIYRPNLKPTVYLSALNHCLCMIGNSSSAHFEAPYFGTPCLEVGTRQAGRKRLYNVTQATGVAPSWEPSLLLRLHPMQPYGDGHAAGKIADTLGRVNPAQLMWGL